MLCATNDTILTLQLGAKSTHLSVAWRLISSMPEGQGGIEERP